MSGDLEVEVRVGDWCGLSCAVTGGGEKRTKLSRAGRRAGVQCCHPAPGEPHVLGGQTAAVTTSLAQ